MKKAKIVSTLGPASSSEEMLEQLIAAGVDVFRLNFSHGTQEDHTGLVERVRRVAHSMGRPVAILQDLQVCFRISGRLWVRISINTRPIHES